jgi:hypothetical protein
LSVHDAAAQGDLNTVKQFIETGTASVNQRDRRSFLEWAVLHYAASRGHKEIIKFLLSQGATLDIKDRNNGTPLTTAIKFEHADITQLLLEKGADPNNTSDESSTEGGNLHIAAQIGNCIIINQLLQHDASHSSQKNRHRRTPLHTAVLHCQPRSILALYPRVDATLRDSFNQTPIEILIEWISQDLSTEDPRLMQCLYAFLWAGADINNEKLISRTEKEALSPHVLSIIQEAIQDVSALDGLSSRVIIEFLTSSNVEHKQFLKEIHKLRSSLPLEIVDQIALDYLIDSDNASALDTQPASNYSLRR